MTDRVKRRLAAILAADIAGYSRLMGDDDAATVRDLKNHQAVVLPLISEFGGRIIDTAGDGILAEFPSAVAAVECAIEIQKIMAARNRGEIEARRMQFRIGINLGDVIHDETRIYGDGINVAARLENIAEPGGICISEDVHRQVRDKLDLPCRDLGEQLLKNISRPVRVYAVTSPGSASVDSQRAASAGPITRERVDGSAPLPAKFSRRRRRVFAAVAAAVAGTLTWATWRQWQAPSSQRRDEPQASVVGVQSIAILPFQRLESKTGEDEYLGLGLADALITSLGSVQQIIVRPTTSVVRYNNGIVDPIAAGREQGVDAVIAGTLQKSGQRLRLAVRLLRVRDGASLWAGRFDEDFHDLFRMQDSISEQVTRALVLKLTNAQHARVNRRYTDNVKAYQLYMQGRFQWNRFNEEGFRNSIVFFEEALQLDPNYALAYVGISEAYSAMVATGAAEHGAASAKARLASEKAVALDGELAEAHQALGGNKLLIEWDWSGAEHELSTAMTLNPNLPEAHSLYGYYLQAMGRVQEAVSVTRRAVDLDPLSALLRSDLAAAHYYAGSYDQAIVEYERALQLDPKFPAIPFLVIGQALERKGAYAEAIKRCEQAIKVAGRDPGVLATLAYALASAGKRVDAKRIASELEDRWRVHRFSPSTVALAYWGVEDRQKAIQWLETAYREHDVQILWLKVDPQLATLRADARFAEIMRRMGLAP